MVGVMISVVEPSGRGRWKIRGQLAKNHERIRGCVAADMQEIFQHESAMLHRRFGIQMARCFSIRQPSCSQGAPVVSGKQSAMQRRVIREWWKEFFVNHFFNFWKDNESSQHNEWPGSCLMQTERLFVWGWGLGWSSIESSCTGSCIVDSGARKTVGNDLICGG